jgi:hypothetical protein
MTVCSRSFGRARREVEHARTCPIVRNGVRTVQPGKYVVESAVSILIVRAAFFLSAPFVS